MNRWIPNSDHLQNMINICRNIIKKTPFKRLPRKYKKQVKNEIKAGYSRKKWNIMCQLTYNYYIEDLS